MDASGTVIPVHLRRCQNQTENIGKASKIGTLQGTNAISAGLRSFRVGSHDCLGMRVEESGETSPSTATISRRLSSLWNDANQRYMSSSRAGGWRDSAWARNGIARSPTSGVRRKRRRTVRILGRRTSFKQGDVADLSTGDLPGTPDLVWASFPCQDLSLAGMGAGLSGKRSGTFAPFWRLDAEAS